MRMKKQLLVITTLLLILNVTYAQTNVYQPFPSDSAVWFFISQGPPPGNSTWSFTKWLGDTLINSKSYTKVFQAPGSLNWSYSGGIRQDIPNEKIYFVNLNGVEQDISVSQHLIVGDSMILSCPMVIESIDSAQIGTKFHKLYNLQNSSLQCSGTYIVGVGMTSEEGFEYGSNLVCFSVGNINQIGTTTHCQLTTSVTESTKSENKLFVFPNPFSFSTTLKTNDNFKNAILTVYNSFGQQVKQIKNISGQTFTLYRDNFPSGLYYIRLIRDNKLIMTDKLIITD